VVSTSPRPHPTILNIHRGQDTGGQGFRIFDAFRRLAPEWGLRSMYRPNSFLYLAYPVDLEWDGELAKQLYAAADLVHLHNGFATADIFERHRRRKPAVVHYHGSAFRQNPTAYLRQQQQRRALGLVSTLDLWLIAPGELEWLPSPHNLASLRATSSTTRRP
jgi:hypothetical protein